MGKIMDRFRAKRNAKVESKQAKYEAQTAAAKQASSAIASGVDASQVLGNLKSVGLDLTSTPGQKLGQVFGGIAKSVGGVLGGVATGGASTALTGIIGSVTGALKGTGGTSGTVTPSGFIAPVAPVDSASGTQSESFVKKYGVVLAIAAAVVGLLIFNKRK